MRALKKLIPVINQKNVMKPTEFSLCPPRGERLGEQMYLSDRDACRKSFTGGVDRFKRAMMNTDFEFKMRVKVPSSALSAPDGAG